MGSQVAFRAAILPAVVEFGSITRTCHKGRESVDCVGGGFPNSLFVRAGGALRVVGFPRPAVAAVSVADLSCSPPCVGQHFKIRSHRSAVLLREKEIHESEEHRRYLP
jgi:hypothetical protein